MKRLSRVALKGRYISTKGAALRKEGKTFVYP